MGWRCHEQDLPLLFPFLYVSSPCAINHLTLVFYLATPLLEQTNPFTWFKTHFSLRVATENKSFCVLFKCLIIRVLK
jgi:hypothetical protein